MLARLSRLPTVALLSGVVLPVAGQVGDRAKGRHEQPSAAAADRTTNAPLPSLLAGLRLVALPPRPSTDQVIQLTVHVPPPGANDYRWELDGRGYTVSTGSAPRATVVFRTPGIHTVAVRVAGNGTTETAPMAIDVQARAGARTLPPSRARARRSTVIAPTIARRPRSAQRTRPPSRAHAAGDPGVTIADFQFTPGTTTVHLGDTITWTNNGPSAHTATARNGSFDTGVLQKGASASHTFTQAGTFNYYCKIHPFMHGTIEVLAATTTTPSTGSGTGASSGTSGSGGGRGTGEGGASGGVGGSGGGGGSGQSPSSSAPAPAASSPATSAQPLPLTGFDLILSVLFAIGLIGLGLALRRAQRR